jgi:hypothetical protein
MKKIVFDWSLRRGVVAIVVSEDGGKYTPVEWKPLPDRTGLDLMLDSLTEPHEIIGEATFESYILEHRRDFTARCEKEGHILRTLPSRLTPRKRRALGMVKSDENDALAMVDLADKESRFSVYHEPPADDDPELLRREGANHDLMILRASGDKDKYADGFIARLSAFKDQPEVRRKALGNGKQYNPVKVAAVAIAADYSLTQREFDQLSGLYAHAYPSQIRADLMHWGWAGGSKRPKLVKEIDPSGETDKMVPVVPSARVDGLTLTEYRRELRWLYRQIRAMH